MPFSPELLDRIRKNDPNLKKLIFTSGQFSEMANFFLAYQSLLKNSAPSAMLESTPGLSLPFNDNDILDLANALKVNSYVSELVIHGEYHNQDSTRGWMTDKGAIALAQCPNLVKLDLQGNAIGDDAVSALVEHTKIRELQLQNCNLGIRSAIELLKSKMLQKIFCDGNPCFNHEYSDTGIKLLEPLQESEKGLFTFSSIWSKRFNEKIDVIKSKDSAKDKTHLEQQRIENQCVNAINQDNPDKLIKLVNQLPTGINTRLEYGAPLLIIAVENNKLNCAKWLLQAGARIECDERKYTPLFIAAENRHVNMVKLLLQHGANMTGEFDFNKETALTIATFKFLEQIKKNITPDFFKQFTIEAQSIELKRANLAINTFLNNSKRNSWIALGDDKKLYSTLIISAFMLYHQLAQRYRCSTQASSSTDIRLPKDNPMKRYAETVTLLENKRRIIMAKPNERPDLLSITNFNQRHELRRELRLNPVKRKNQTVTQWPQHQLNHMLQNLSAKLQKSKFDEFDWSDYPSLFVAQYRCIHYYKHHFSWTQRDDHAYTSHLNRIAPSPAAYTMSGLNPQQHQLARESTLAGNAGRIVDLFDKLESIKPASFGNKTFNNASDAIQEQMSNSYAAFYYGVKQGNHPYYKLLHDNDILAYPHYATSDLPRHTLRYGYGLKRVSTLAQGILTPEYNSQGKPKYPILGKAYISLFSPEALAAHKARHVYTMHQNNEIELKVTIAPERETSIPGGVRAEQVFFEACLDVPDFSIAYSEDEHFKRFGLTQQQFTHYKKGLAGKRSKQILGQLLEAVCTHKERYFLSLSQSQANLQGGQLIYCHDKNHYFSQPKKLTNVERLTINNQSNSHAQSSQSVGHTLTVHGQFNRTRKRSQRAAENKQLQLEDRQYKRQK